MMHTRNWAFPLLITAFAVYLIGMFPLYGEGLFTYDSFYSFWRAQRVIENPLSIFEPTFIMRFSPFYYLLLSFTHSFFGFNPFIYGLINGVLHILSSLLLFKLIRRLTGGSDIPAALASLVFLFSSTQWGVLWDMGQTMRLACVSLFLSSLLFFVKFFLSNRRTDYAFSLIFFLFSFGFSEDSASLPLLLLMVMFLIPIRPFGPIRKFLLTLPFFSASLIYGFFSLSVGGPQNVGLKIQPHIFLNFLFLIREFLQFLLIPRPEWIPFSGVPGLVLRLVPAFLIFLFAAFLWRWKKDRITDPALRTFVGRQLTFGMAWIGITSGLYALRPMPGAWQGRYLYIPGIGEAIVVGAVLYLIGRSLFKVPDRGTRVGIQRVLSWGFLGIIFYGLVLNISTTFLMVRRARSEIHPATQEELPVVFSVVSAIRDRYGAPLEIPPDLILMIEGLPFSTARLKELLRTYYASVPRMIVETKEGEPLKALAPSENQRILHLKWEGQNLQAI